MQYSVDRITAGPLDLDKTIVDFPGEKLIFRFYPLGQKPEIPPTETPIFNCPWFAIGSVSKAPAAE